MALVIGDMRYSIKVKALTLTKDDYGSTVETYTDTMTLRAAVKYLGGTKDLDNKETFTSQSIQFTTHYRAITPTMRIEFQTKMYRINNISPIAFNEGLIITAELIND